MKLVLCGLVLAYVGKILHTIGMELHEVTNIPKKCRDCPTVCMLSQRYNDMNEQANWLALSIMGGNLDVKTDELDMADDDIRYAVEKAQEAIRNSGVEMVAATDSVRDSCANLAAAVVAACAGAETFIKRKGNLRTTVTVCASKANETMKGSGDLEPARIKRETITEA